MLKKKHVFLLAVCINKMHKQSSAFNTQKTCFAHNTKTTEEKKREKERLDVYDSVRSKEIQIDSSHLMLMVSWFACQVEERMNELSLIWATL